MAELHRERGGGVIHGVVIKHHGKNQEEELRQEVKRQEEDNTQNQMRMSMTMDEMERHCEALEPNVTHERIKSTYPKTVRNVLNAAQ